MYCLVPTAPFGSTSSCALVSCNASIPSNEVTVWANEAEPTDSSTKNVIIPGLAIDCIFLRTTTAHRGEEQRVSQPETPGLIGVCTGTTNSLNFARTDTIS